MEIAMYKIKTFFVVISTLLMASVATADTARPFGETTFPESFAVIFGGGSGSLPGNLTPIGITDVGGFVADDDSGVDLVRVQIIRDANNQTAFWDGTTFQSQPRWLAPITDGESWFLPDVDLSVLGDYDVRLLIIDNAGNRADAIDNNIHVIRTVDDQTDPTAQFVSPGALRVLTPGQPAQRPNIELPLGSKPILLNVEDDLTGVADVFLQVYHHNSGEYWNGTAWQSDPAWQPAQRCGGFLSDHNYCSENDVSFDRTGLYSVRTSITDEAGNRSTGAESQQLLLLLIPDTTIPTGFTLGFIREVLEPDGRLRKPGRTATSGVQDITGVANDEGEGVELVRVQFERRAGGTIRYWNGNAWQASPIWVRADLIQTANDWRWRVTDVDFVAAGQYATRLSITDLAGNRSTARQNPIALFVVE